MYESQCTMYDTSLSNCPGFAESFDTSQVEAQLVLLAGVCDQMFPQGVKSLEQLTRGLMGALWDHVRIRSSNPEDSVAPSYAEQWNTLNVPKWDPRLDKVKRLLSDPTYEAILKLASVVLGLPFADRTKRLAWCRRWSSLLLTWAVARGFAADTRLRPPSVQDY